MGSSPLSQQLITHPYLQTIDFKLKPPQGTPGARFVFAAADRRVLRLLRDSRWDLTTFTTPVESLKNIDDGVIVMSENGEVTKALLQHETGLAHALRPGAPLEWFESLVVSDGVADIPSVRCVAFRPLGHAGRQR